MLYPKPFDQNLYHIYIEVLVEGFGVSLSCERERYSSLPMGFDESSKFVILMHFTESKKYDGKKLLVKNAFL